jgi:DNA-binding GntR family transcriptional regulator
MIVQYRSAAELAAEDIRHRIHAGQLEAGAKISISDLAAEMRLSSTPVREALKALELEGLVSITPRSGVHVRRISRDEVAEVYAIKERLEPLIVRWAILRGTPDQIRSLIGFARTLGTYARRQELEEYVRTVEERHQALLAMADSDVLASIFQGLDGRVRLLRYRNLTQPGKMRSFARKHEQIARAIADQDVDRACALTAENVRSAAQSLLRLLNEDNSGAATSGDRRPAWSIAEELMAPLIRDRDTPPAKEPGQLAQAAMRPSSPGSVSDPVSTTPSKG